MTNDADRGSASKNKEFEVDLGNKRKTIDNRREGRIFLLQIARR